ncbi:hypothetical protein HELRODRAFT_188611 [Helobdella robusta]|uniref:Uncharacterized protein n=1 Tax=Helobdella robusta TaxID=6412 RepID=T1FQ66_HELRO|nr:hypothetical protein HELRODRAFT_188611 [Helobdella robusta]ESO02177.1 hypothetical protein HELRODRAFT_188611 [Helobdella robusta]
MTTLQQLSDKEAAVVKKMFGRLTRECTLWHPAKLLCVRFNVEDPYPERHINRGNIASITMVFHFNYSSVIVGLPVSKKAKHSIFNFLQHNFTTSGDVIKNDNDVEQSLNSKAVDADFNRKPPTQATKPLAILSKVDLRVPQSSSSSEAAVSNIHLIPADDVMSRNQQPLEIKSATTLATSTITTTSIVATAATSTKATDIACGGSNDRDDDDAGGGVDNASGENVEPKRPSIDLFKAIFEDDDDDEDEVGNGNDEETYDDTDKVDVDATNKSSPTSDNYISFNSSNLDQNSTTSGAVLNVPDDCIASAENDGKTPKNESTVRPGSIISTTFSSFQATLHPQRHFFKPPDKKEKDSHDPAKHKKSRKHKSSDKHKKHKKSKKSKKKNHKRDQSSDDDDSDSDEDAHRHNDEHKHSKKDEKLLSKLKRYSLTLPH